MLFGDTAMTTLVLDKTTEQTPLGEILRNASDSIIEIRSEKGELMATVTLPPTIHDGFDYGPYMAEACRVVDEYLQRPPDARPALTSRELLDSLNRLDAPE